MSIPKLIYSRDIHQVVERKDTMTAEEALQVLADELLGPCYYITDPVGGKQANAIICNDILARYAPKKRLK